MRKKKGKYVNQLDIARLIVRNLKVPIYIIEQVIQEFQIVLIEELKQGNAIHLKRMGTFKLKKFKPKKRMNVFKKEIIDVPSKIYVKFVAGGLLKRIITEGEKIELREEQKNPE